MSHISNVLWRLPEMVSAMEGRLLGEANKEAVTGISIDTRTLQSGEAYFAIKGDVHDGHAFVANAAKAGAAVSVVSEENLADLPEDCGTLIVVDDVLRALERLGVAARARCHGKIVAVTGSVGKTTTKEALRGVLATCGKTHAAVASFNNHWGVPLTLARMHADTEFGVFEIGMNHPGEITPLVQMVRPHVAMINNVAAVHLGAFSSVDEIARAKAEIFDGLDEGGVALINADDERFELQKRFAAEKGVAKIVSFGEAKTSDTRLEKLVMHDTCSCLTADVMGTSVMTKIGAPGRHIAQNALAVLSVVKLLGADLTKASLALADMTAVKGRGQRHKLGKTGKSFVFIDETYNANPTSMSAALSLLGSTKTGTHGRRIAVLGDMLELGPTSAELHAGMADAIRANNIDLVFLVGLEMESLARALKTTHPVVHVPKVEDIIAPVSDEIRAGDVVMAKASLGIGFARLVEHLLNTFSTDS